MSLIIKDISHIHPNHEILFHHIRFTVATGEKVSLIGNNGNGKSTLLSIIAGNIKPASGEIITSDKPYYSPQHFGQYNHLTIARALGIDQKITAFHRILAGDLSELNYTLLDDDWEIEDRAKTSLEKWEIGYLPLNQSLNSLSGGEKSKVFLAGITIHSPDIILLDEPTNHLDTKSRKRLYDFIESSKSTILIVSHDRTLLNLLSMTLELTKDHIDSYGGNYEFYKQEKEKKEIAFQKQLSEKEKELRKAQKTARESLERQHKHDVRGEKSNIKKVIHKIMMGNLKDKAEKSSSKLKDIHTDKITGITETLSEIRAHFPTYKNLQLNINNTNLHSGKILFEAKDLNFGYNEQLLWKSNLNFQIRSGERILIKGDNGSGKTSLIKLILKKISPTTGSIKYTEFRSIYLDQEYSLIRNDLTVFEQIEEYNSRKLPEYEMKTILNRFLFPKDSWNKSNSNLSGGEKMRLLLCCLQVSNNMPDIFILDEPTNNLDIQSLNILTTTIKNYKGTLLLVSHDEYFLNEIGIDKELRINS